MWRDQTISMPLLLMLVLLQLYIILCVPLLQGYPNRKRAYIATQGRSHSYVTHGVCIYILNLLCHVVYI